MQFQLERAVEVLSRTPTLLETMLAEIDPAWVQANEGGDSWSPFDIVGHLIHGERTDWLPRLRHILERGTEEPFEPFDRFAQFQASEGRTLEALLETFRELRSSSLAELKAMDLRPEMLDREGLHPELGRVTARQLLATWVVHDLGHVAQISRVMAKQYKQEIGPWQEYLPIVHDRTD